MGRVGSCGQCSAPVQDGARFCSACGAAVDVTVPAGERTMPLAAGERRQLTVLFCDLVDSTRLAAPLDPEDWREALAGFQKAVRAVVARHDGYVAQYAGDGIVVYFGYPQAHEDNASRGVHAGLGIVEAVQALNSQAALTFAVRIGIHVGLTVVGHVGDAQHHEVTALGHTTNVAARLQTVAPPNGVAVSEAVRRLTAGEFATEDLGRVELKGLQPTQAHLVVEPTGVHSRLASAEHLTPFTGREHELVLLRDRWGATRGRSGQAVLITGEPGIGKSRLVLALRDELVAERYTWLECRATPYTANSAFALILELVRHGLAFSEADTPAEKLGKLRQRAEANRLPVDEVVQVIGALLGLRAVGVGAASPTPEELRARTIDLLVEWVLVLGQHQPVLLFVEDLHWCDPSTVEFLGCLIERISTGRIMVLLTARPEFEVPWPPRSHLSIISLSRLSRRHVSEMLEHLGQSATLPADTVARVMVRADGIPLYVEELMRMAVDLDEPSATGNEAASRAIPETLQDSLMARLDRLGNAKDLAQLASVVGQEFSTRLLERVTDLDSAAFQTALGRLTHAGIVYAPGGDAEGRCLFKHALLRDAAYHSLLKSSRRRYHHRIADELARSFPATVENQPEVLARHYTEAQRPTEAIQYWMRAGRQALACFANQEAITYLQEGLALIEHLEETPERLGLELELQLALGPPLMARRGYADPLMERAYGRARELARQLGDPPALFPVLFGLWTYNCVRARHAAAGALATEMTALAEREENPSLLLEADVAAGITHFYRGQFAEARRRLARVEEIYDPTRDADHPFVFGQDPRAAALAHRMLVEWTLGELDAAVASSQRALALADALSHPFSVSYLLAFAAWFQRLRGDAEACRALAARGIEVSRPRTLSVFLAISEILHGSALVSLGQHGDGMERLEAGLGRFKATASTLILPFWYGLQAQAQVEVGNPAAGVASVNEALALVRQTDERHGEAELHRLRGELLAATGGRGEDIEAALRQALDVAAAQRARSWTLRAAITLCRHLCATGRASEGREILAAARAEIDAATGESDVSAADRLLSQG